MDSPHVVRASVGTLAEQRQVDASEAVVRKEFLVTRCARIFGISSTLVLVAFYGTPARSATIEADVVQAGMIVSDEFGFAHIARNSVATIEIYLALDPGELASTFEAGFDLEDADFVDVVVDLGRVNPGIEPFGVGDWPNAFADLMETQVRVALTRPNLGGRSLVVDLLITTFDEDGAFEVVLADREAAADLDDPPFIEFIPIGTETGTVLATVLVPEPSVGLSIGSLLVLGCLRLLLARGRMTSRAVWPARQR